MNALRVQEWAARLVQRFRIGAAPPPAPTIQDPWAAVETSSLVQDLHEVCCAINQAAGLVLVQEERRKRPFICPAEYLYFRRKVAYFMRLEVGPGQHLSIVFSTDRAGRIRNRLPPQRKERRRLVLSPEMLNDAPIGACFAFLLSGFSKDEWVALCMVGTNEEVAKLMPARAATPSNPARTQAAVRRAMMKLPRLPKLPAMHLNP